MQVWSSCRASYAVFVGCRYQVFDAYSHSQVDMTGVSVVPHITYTLQQPTTKSSQVSLLQYVHTINDI